MPQPFFTVIIPTLNEARYLPRLLTDLTQQTYTAFEVLIVDAHSEDKTVEVAQQLADKLPLKVLVSKKRNVSWQRNLAGKEAQGKYLIFFDADVQIPPRFLERLHKNLESAVIPLATTYIKADSRSVYDQMIAQLFYLIAEASLIVERPFAPGFNFIVKKRAFTDVGGFREDVRHAEDHELATRMYRHGYGMVVFKQPQLVFSLRRYREEGRLKVLRKNARAGLHVLTQGPITKDIFNYPMGGGWYKNHKTAEKNGLDKAQAFIKKLVKLFVD